ncbi:MAG: hypothetical protein ACI85Q_002048 [Salibacteraceae bacterium]
MSLSELCGSNKFMPQGRDWHYLFYGTLNKNEKLMSRKLKDKNKKK